MRQIQVFLAVSRLNSYSKAAQELALTQPAVSAQVRQLEDVIGAPVFDYLGKQLYLTPVGETVQRAARDLLQRLVGLEMELAELRGLMHSTDRYRDLPGGLERYRSGSRRPGGGRRSMATLAL